MFLNLKTNFTPKMLYLVWYLSRTKKKVSKKCFQYLQIDTNKTNKPHDKYSTRNWGPVNLKIKCHSNMFYYANGNAFNLRTQ